MRQQLKINGIWAILPQNFKVTIKRTNPLFNSEGDFSFPFSLDPRLNKAILESAADPLGRFSLRRLNGLDCEYWFDGQLLFRGYTEVNSSLQFKDTIQLNFNSGVKSITNRVKDLNAQQVSVERLQLGYACTGLRFSRQEESEVKEIKWHLPTSNAGGNAHVRIVHMPGYDTGHVPAPVKNALYTLDAALNVSRDSREFPYCNTRVALDITNENRLRVLDYKRRDSAPCMFVLYWLKRLFLDLDIAITNEFENMEDMCRLAFFSTFPKYTTEDWQTPPTGVSGVYNPLDETTTYIAPWSSWSMLPQYELGAPYTMKAYFFHDELVLYDKYYDKFVKLSAPVIPAGSTTRDDHEKAQYEFRPAFLSSEQYPDTKVQTILDDLHDIFGLRIIYDTVTNHARVCYIKDVLANAPTKSLPAEYHGQPVVTRNLNPGIIISYGKERADDSFSVAEAAYDYDMPSDERMVIQQPFADTLSMVHNSTDHHTYYDPKTGNAAVIAVDEDSEDYMQGSTPLEVGQFNDYRASVTDIDKATTRKANFEPIVCNDIYHSETGAMSYTESNLCPFVDAEQTVYPGENIFEEDENGQKNENRCLMYETFDDTSTTTPTEAIVYGQNGNTPYVSYSELYNIFGKGVDASDDAFLKWRTWFMPVGMLNGVLMPTLEHQGEIAFRFALLLQYATNSGESCDMTSSDSPLQQWQDGKHYVLGFMRGAGNDSGIDYDSDNFNTDGTRGWESVVGTPTFTADSVDQFGNVFDYNGTEAGGIDQSERLSLKLDARKVKSYDADGTPTFYPIDSNLANRGVAVKMLSSLLHFETHNKTITHKASVAIGAIMNIDWCSQYPMQDCVGFINSIQVELSESGVGESTIEQYVLDE